MSWDLMSGPSRRAAARLLVAHRAGLIRLGRDEELCLAVISSVVVKRNTRARVGRLWLEHGRSCPAAGQHGALSREDPRDSILAEMLDHPPPVG